MISGGDFGLVDVDDRYTAKAMAQSSGFCKALLSQQPPVAAFSSTEPLNSGSQLLPITAWPRILHPLLTPQPLLDFSQLPVPSIPPRMPSPYLCP